MALGKLGTPLGRWHRVRRPRLAGLLLWHPRGTNSEGEVRGKGGMRGGEGEGEGKGLCMVLDEEWEGEEGSSEGEGSWRGGGEGEREGEGNGENSLNVEERVGE